MFFNMFAVGAYNLVILNVRAEDEGHYQCQLSATFAGGQRVDDAASRQARLSVLGVPVRLVKILLKLYEVCINFHFNFMYKEPPAEVRLTKPEECTFGVACNVICIVRGGRPPPTIRWRIDNEDLVPIETLLPPPAQSSSPDSSISMRNMSRFEQLQISTQKQLPDQPFGQRNSIGRRFLVPPSSKQWHAVSRELEGIIAEVEEVHAAANSPERCASAQSRLTGRTWVSAQRNPIKAQIDNTKLLVYDIELYSTFGMYEYNNKFKQIVKING